MGLNTTVIAAYGPNEDDNATSKDTFWKELNLAVETNRSVVIIASWRFKCKNRN